MVPSPLFLFFHRVYIDVPFRFKVAFKLHKATEWTREQGFDGLQAHVNMQHDMLIYSLALS